MQLLWITQLDPRDFFVEIILKLELTLNNFGSLVAELLLLFGPVERCKIPQDCAK